MNLDEITRRLKANLHYYRQRIKETAQSQDKEEEKYYRGLAMATREALELLFIDLDQ